MNIEELTLGQIRELQNLVSNKETKNNSFDESLIGKYYIFRTYSAGVFFGKLVMKKENECIIDECRRLYYWKTTNDGISLSEVALFGLHKDSKVCAETNKHWIQVIEIIPCTNVAIKSIQGSKNHVA